MKIEMKYNLLIVITALCVLLSSCVSTRGELPYGIWQSENPYIVLHVTQEGDWRGEYEQEGKTIDVSLEFAIGYKGMGMVNPDNRKENEIYEYYGTYTFNKNKLTYKLTPYFVKRYGFKTITFKKIEDYKPETLE